MTMLVASMAVAALASMGRFPLGVVVAEANVDGLRARVTALQEEAEGIMNLADGEDRDLTDEETDRIEAIAADVAKFNRQITAREAVRVAATSRGRQTTPTATPANGRESVPAQPRGADAARHGFQNGGEFAMAVRGAERYRRDGVGSIDNRLIRNAAPGTAGSEGIGADGGFLVPPEFAQGIWQKVMDNGTNLMTLTDELTTSKNEMKFPADETTPWQSSGGVQAYWEGELAARTQSKPSFEQKSVRLNKLTALVNVSEELLEDAPGLDSYLRTKAPVKMVAKVNTAIVRGTGVGQPRGILRSDSLITITKESGQSADTVLAANVNKMWNRLYADCRRNAVWLINQDIEPQLDLMEFKPGSSTPVPMYVPPGGISEQPYAKLKGRPVIPVPACSTLGDKGDIILVDLKQYMGLKKGDAIKTDVSMHLFFDADAVAYKFTFRVGGQPWWNTAISPENGTTTMSWATCIEDRT